MTLLKSISVPLGEDAKEFSLEGSDGKTYAFNDFADAKVLVIVFMCNHCPYVQAIWGRLVALQNKYRDNGVQFVGINPNVGSSGYDEETLEKMKEYSEKYSMNFPYLSDESQAVALAYKAQCTPDIYVYDGERKLVYHGRVDDNWQDEDVVSSHELDEALAALLDGRKPDEDQNPSMGCSIKWK